MVTNPRAQARARAIKPLNAPVTVTVTSNERGMPLSFSSGKKTYEVVATEDMWKINDEWWRGPDEEIERMYYSLLLESGHKTVVYLDMKSGDWFRQAAR